MFTCKKAPLAAAAALVVVGLAGCFGGGGDDAPAAVVTNGTMVDGVVLGADVYCDVNGNGVGDATEPKTKTSLTDGSYKFDDCKFAVVGTGGTNKDTGFNFTGLLKSPAGATFMTPLTTLVTGTGLSTADLAKLLGLPEGTDPTKVDPTTDVDLMKTTLAVQQIMAQLAAMLQAGGSTLSLEALYAQVATSLAEVLKSAPAGTTLISGTGLNVDLLVAAAKAAAKTAGSSINDDALLTLANSIASEAAAFLSAASLDDLVKKAQQLQDPKKPAAGSSYFTLNSDSIDFIQTPLTNVKTVPLSTLTSTGAQVSSLNKFALAVSVTGQPTVSTSAVALNMVEAAGGQDRALTAMISKVTLVLDANNQLSLSVPADATVHVYGKKQGGSEVSGSFKMGANQGTKVVRVESNKLTIDYSGLVNRVLDSTSITEKDKLAYWEGLQGTFKVTAAISNFDLRTTDKKALASTKVEVKNVAGGLLGSVNGVGFSGNVTIGAN